MEHLCALQVLLCALVSRPTCTRAQLRGTVGTYQLIPPGFCSVCPIGIMQKLGCYKEVGTGRVFACMPLTVCPKLCRYRLVSIYCMYKLHT